VRTHNTCHKTIGFDVHSHPYALQFNLSNSTRAGFSTDAARNQARSGERNIEMNSDMLHTMNVEKNVRDVTQCSDVERSCVYFHRKWLHCSGGTRQHT
jgi:hypothetical protein